MNFLYKLFRGKMVDCPRCLGKGHVNLDDIKRLKRELSWAPGKCAYCNGLRKVPFDRSEKVNTDFEYLTADLPSWEREKVINGDSDALERAEDFNKSIQNIINYIERSYYIEKKVPDEIAEHIFHEQGRFEVSLPEKEELIDYIEKVIKNKHKN